MNIILASGSPRRRELLAQAGFEFKVEVSNADENVIEESPEQMVEELAARKAEAVVRLHNKAEDAGFPFRPNSSGIHRSCIILRKKRYCRKKRNIS